MLILAIEQSTALGSAAVLRGSRVLAARRWEESALRNQRLFAVLPELLSEAAAAPADVDLFAIGVGPGSFSGVRIAVSAAQGLALPGGQPVAGVSSAEALAWDLWRETGQTPVTVVGDARRQRLWRACFAAEGGADLALAAPIALIHPDELRSLSDQAGLVVSPEWERIGDLLSHSLPAGVTLIRESRAPRAETVGLLAGQRSAAGLPPAPAQPIYLTPPVSVAPRFQP